MFQYLLLFLSLFFKNFYFPYHESCFQYLSLFLKYFSFSFPFFFLLLVVFVFYFETGSHCIALNLWSFCLSLLSRGLWHYTLLLFILKKRKKQSKAKTSSSTFQFYLLILMFNLPFISKMTFFFYFSLFLEVYHLIFLILIYAVLLCLNFFVFSVILKQQVQALLFYRKPFQTFSH